MAPPRSPSGRARHLPAQNMLSVMRMRVEALQTGRSTMGTFTTCRTWGCTSDALIVHVSLRLPQPVTRPLYPDWSNLWVRKMGLVRTDPSGTSASSTVP